MGQNVCVNILQSRTQPFQTDLGERNLLSHNGYPSGILGL